MLMMSLRPVPLAVAIPYPFASKFFPTCHIATMRSHPELFFYIFDHKCQESIRNGCLDCIARHPLVLILVGRRLYQESVFSLRRPNPLDAILQQEGLSKEKETDKMFTYKSGAEEGQNIDDEFISKKEKYGKKR